MKAGRHENKAHKAILVSKCDYFRTVLLKDPTVKEIILHGVSEAVLPDLLEFVYTGQVKTKNVIHLSGLAVAGEVLEIPSLKLICLDHIERAMDLSNVIPLFQSESSAKFHRIYDACLR